MIGERPRQAIFDKRRTFAPWALWLALAALGCGHPEESLQWVQRAQDSVTLVGERRYTCKLGSRFQQSRERVILAQGGRFRVELLEIDGKRPDQMDDIARGRFTQLAARYEGSLGRRVRLERDFRIRDTLLASGNYELVTQPQQTRFLDRDALALELRSKYDGGDDWSCSLTVDAQTGFVVRCIERDASGGTVAEMIYDRIDFSPDLSAYDVDSFDFVGRVGVDPTPVPIDFSLYRPGWLPPGFVFATQVVTVVKAAQRVVVELIYTDGIREIAIFQNRSLDGSPWNGPPGSREPYEVRLLSFGNVAMADLVIANVDIHVESKIDPSSLATVIESLASQ